MPFAVFCQEKGVHFERGLSWKAIKAKARKEHKYIFMDCFTTWCGPCKFMSQQIFPLGEVGRALNDKFVCASVQMDSTGKDQQVVKDWYTDVQSIAKEYKINAYPSFLFFSPDGRVLHKVMGASKDAQEFLAKVNDALMEDKQYFTLIDHYRQRKGDSTFLHNALMAALGAGDNNEAASIGDMYIDCLKNPYVKITWN